MKTKMPLILTLAILSVVRPAQAAATLQETMQDFLKRNFPEQNLRPTPYGADSRYAPKTVWSYLNNLSKPNRTTAVTSGWVAVADGNMFYPETIVKLRSEPIDVSRLEMSDSMKLALAAGLTAKLQGLPADFKLDASLTNFSSVDVELPELEIEYVYYLDMLQAQDLYRDNLERMYSLLKAREGESARIRVVITALRAKNAQVIVRSVKARDLDFEAKFTQYLANFGFKWNRDHNAFETLRFSDWRYIAYEALQSKKGTWQISEASVEDDSTLPPQQNSNALAMELFAAKK